MSTTEDRRPQPAAVDDWTDQLESQRRQLQAERTALDKQREELAAAQSETSRQRRYIAGQLRARRAELLCELERRRAELAEQAVGENFSLAQQLAELSVQYGRLQEVVARRERDAEELSEQISSLRRQPAEQPSGGDTQELELLQRRFELAVQDVRELKTRNAELEEELEELRRSSAARPNRSEPAAGLNWEAQKRHLLEQLETDLDDGHSRQAADKLTVAGAIRITDQVVAEKEQEIRELEKLLHEQSANIGGLAVGAAAVAELLDHDELIRDERQNLKRLQDEWREKLRQAEVEISIERAKMARERSQTEEKLQAYERQLSQSPNGNAGNTGDGGTKPAARGRWLARLGLKNGDEQ